MLCFDYVFFNLKDMIWALFTNVRLFISMINYDFLGGNFYRNIRSRAPCNAGSGNPFWLDLAAAAAAAVGAFSSIPTIFFDGELTCLPSWLPGQTPFLACSPGRIIHADWVKVFYWVWNTQEPAIVYEVIPTKILHSNPNRLSFLCWFVPITSWQREGIFLLPGQSSSSRLQRKLDENKYFWFLLFGKEETTIAWFDSFYEPWKIWCEWCQVPARERP